jgi:DNA repair protein RecO
VLAKGSLKEGSGFLGPLDLLEAGEALLYPRRDGLSILGGFDRETSFRALRRSLPRLEAAFSMLEVLAEASREEHADPALHALALESLRDLEGCPVERVPLALLRFDLRLLAVLGLGPVLGACVSCGGALGGRPAPVLSPLRGGALCADCRGGDARAVPATRGVLASLERLGGEDEAAAARIVLGKRDLALARRLAVALLGNALERLVRR